MAGSRRLTRAEAAVLDRLFGTWDAASREALRDSLRVPVAPSAGPARPRRRASATPGRPRREYDDAALAEALRRAACAGANTQRICEELGVPPSTLRLYRAEPASFARRFPGEAP